MALLALIGWGYYNNAADNDSADIGLTAIQYGVATTSVGTGTYVVIGAAVLVLVSGILAILGAQNNSRTPNPESRR